MLHPWCPVRGAAARRRRSGLWTSAVRRKCVMECVYHVNFDEHSTWCGVCCNASCSTSVGFVYQRCCTVLPMPWRAAHGSWGQIGVQADDLRVLYEIHCQGAGLLFEI